MCPHHYVETVAKTASFLYLIVEDLQVPEGGGTEGHTLGRTGETPE